MNLLVVSLLAAQLTLAPVLGARSWFTAPVAPHDVAGNVVVLDVFTVDCINCRNVIPELRRLYAEDHGRGLEIIGIHAPETPAERNHAYVRAELAAQGVRWPVAIDDDFALWRGYGIDAWPTQLFFDRHGRLRKIVVGDSQDDVVRSTVEALLAEK